MTTWILTTSAPFPGRAGQVAIGRYNSKQAPRKPEEDLEEDPMPMPEEDLSRWLLGETELFFTLWDIL